MELAARPTRPSTGPADPAEVLRFLRGVPVLAGLGDDVLELLAPHATAWRFPAGSYADRADAPCEHLWVVRGGQADVLRADQPDAAPVARLACGSYFGELGVLTDRDGRWADVRVRDGGDLLAWGFEAQRLHRIVARKLLETAAPVELGGDVAALGRARSIGVLRGLRPADLRVVAAAAQEHHWAAGATVFEAGDPGDRFHVVLSGRVEVVRDGRRLAVLAPGAFFGETALLFDVPRTATVQAAADGSARTWSVDRVTFQRVVRSHLLSQTATSTTVLGRVRAA